MRKLLVLLFAAALSPPYCTANIWGSWASSATSVSTSPTPVLTSTITNPAPSTTSPYDGFTATATPTSSYSGSLTTLSSSSIWGSWGSSSQTAVAVVNSTTSSGVDWSPQTTQSYTGTGASTSYTGNSIWGSWATVAMMSQPSTLTPVGSSIRSGPTYVLAADNPEPATVLTFVGGMGALLLWRRMSRKNAK